MFVSQRERLYKTFNVILEKVLEQRWELDLNLLMKLGKASFHGWEEIFKQYTQDIRSRPRSRSGIMRLLEFIVPENIGVKKSSSSKQKRTEKIMSSLEKIDRAYERTSVLFKLHDLNNKARILPINAWKHDDIKLWCKQLRKCNQSEYEAFFGKHIHEVIAVIRRGVNLTKGFDLRDTQLIALLLYLESANSSNGILGQISTGEGKTLVAVMLAIIQNLKGKKVDIITSSSVLAIRDSKEELELYGLFDVSVANNCDMDCKSSDAVRKKRYSCDVLYGDVASFQGDILLSDFYDRDILGGRKPECVIVDEVDSMLLDKGENVLYLSHDIPDLRYLRDVYVVIWRVVQNKNLQSMPVNESTKRIIAHIKEQYKSGDLKFPKYFMKFVDHRMPLWIRSAFAANNMEKGIHYILGNPDDPEGQKRIIVMDNDTGVEQLNTSWNNGLHQFLQLKHTRKLSMESLKAVFMSNFSFFKRYAGCVFGLTGTLGSDADMQLLGKAYGTEFFKLPRFKPYLFYQDKPCVLPTKKLWQDAIVEEVKHKSIKDSRAVLIVCSSVAEAEEMEKLLSPHVSKKKLHKYISAFQKFEIGSGNKNRIETGTVIIATNLAGRGTDLHVSEKLEANGGLHVILPTIPPNVRIERQSFGRAARKGEKGSGRFIVFDKNNFGIDTLKRLRDKEEESRINHIRQHSLESIVMEEQLFERFSKLYGEIEEKLYEEHSGMSKVLRFKIPSSRKKKNKYIELQLKGLRDRWAFWIDSMSLRINSISAIEKENVIKKYEEFESQMGDILKSPDLFRFIFLPREILNFSKYVWDFGRKSDAVACCDKIISDFKLCATTAYYQKGYYLSKQMGMKTTYAKTKIIQAFKKSRELLKSDMERLDLNNQVVKLISDLRRKAGYGGEQNNFSSQIENEIKLSSVHLSAIDEAIGSEMDKNCFVNVIGKDGKRLKDNGNHEKLYDQLRTSATVCKNYRFSKKVKIKYRKLGNELFIFKDNAEHRIILPQIVGCSESKLIKFINSTRIRPRIKKDIAENSSSFLGGVKFAMNKIKTTTLSAVEYAIDVPLLSGDRAKMRTDSVDSDSLKPLVISKEVFWTSFKEAKLLADEIRSIISVTKEKLDKIEFSDIPLCKLKICEILLAKNNKQWSEGLFLGHLDEDSTCKLKALLIKNNLLDNRAFLKLDFDKNSKVTLPVNLKRYKPVIDNLSAKRNKGFIIHMSEIPLLDTQVQSSRALWASLAGQGVIKGCKVNFSLDNSKTRDAIQHKLDTIKGVIKVELKKLFGSDGDQYVDSVLELMEHSIGKIKTIEDPRIDFVKLADSFMRGEYPPELEDFQRILFDDVITLTLQRRLFNADAFYVAMFGVTQITAGVILGLSTSGLASFGSAVLISEGVSDIIFAIQAGVTNNFSWKDYKRHKAMSLVISIATAGIGGVIASMGEVVVEQATLTGFDIFKSISTQVLRETTKAAVISGSNILIGKVFEQIPNEIMVLFGRRIKSAVYDSDNVNNATQKLKKSIGKLFLFINNSDDAQMYLEEATSFMTGDADGCIFNEIVLSMAEQLAVEIPGMIIKGADKLKKSKNGGKGWSQIGMNIGELVLETLVQCGIDSYKIYKLTGLVSDKLNKFSDKIDSMVKELKGKNKTNEADTVSKEDSEYINTFIVDQKEMLVRLMVQKISDVAQSDISTHVNKAINMLTTAVFDFSSEKQTSMKKQEKDDAESLSQQSQEEGVFVRKRLENSESVIPEKRDQGLKKLLNDNITSISELNLNTPIMHPEYKTFGALLANVDLREISSIYQDGSGTICVMTSVAQRYGAGPWYSNSERSKAKIPQYAAFDGVKDRRGSVNKVKSKSRDRLAGGDRLKRDVAIESHARFGSKHRKIVSTNEDSFLLRRSLSKAKGLLRYGIKHGKFDYAGSKRRVVFNRRNPNELLRRYGKRRVIGFGRSKHLKYNSKVRVHNRVRTRVSSYNSRSRINSGYGRGSIYNVNVANSTIIRSKTNNIAIRQMVYKTINITAKIIERTSYVTAAHASSYCRYQEKCLQLSMLLEDRSAYDCLLDMQETRQSNAEKSSKEVLEMRREAMESSLSRKITEKRQELVKAELEIKSIFRDKLTELQNHLMGSVDMKVELQFILEHLSAAKLMNSCVHYGAEELSRIFQEIIDEYKQKVVDIAPHILENLYLMVEDIKKNVLSECGALSEQCESMITTQAILHAYNNEQLQEYLESEEDVYGDDIDARSFLLERRKNSLATKNFELKKKFSEDKPGLFFSQNRTRKFTNIGKKTRIGKATGKLGDSMSPAGKSFSNLVNMSMIGNDIKIMRNNHEGSKLKLSTNLKLEKMNFYNDQKNLKSIWKQKQKKYASYQKDLDTKSHMKVSRLTQRSNDIEKDCVIKDGKLGSRAESLKFGIQKKRDETEEKEAKEKSRHRFLQGQRRREKKKKQLELKEREFEKEMQENERKLQEGLDELKEYEREMCGYEHN